jgi:hypothetical protein
MEINNEARNHLDELNSTHSDDMDEEEEECRVCRGPAEEGCVKRTHQQMIKDFKDFVWTLIF